MNDVKGLYLSGEYLFLIACTEGAMMTGKQAAERAIDDLNNIRM
jgi:oxygen-dependent protoporphyrinogen oxidase